MTTIPADLEVGSKAWYRFCRDRALWNVQECLRESLPLSAEQYLQTAELYAMFMTRAT
jgi:hypothetical protein